MQTCAFIFCVGSGYVFPELGFGVYKSVNDWFSFSRRDREGGHEGRACSKVRKVCTILEMEVLIHIMSNLSKKKLSLFLHLLGYC